MGFRISVLRSRFRVTILSIRGKRVRVRVAGVNAPTFIRIIVM